MRDHKIQEPEKDHWKEVYTNKVSREVSWYQDRPEVSLELIHKLKLPKTAGIIDVGGGNSKLVDFLLEEGYTDISVLDIAENALERAKQRLGKRADSVEWIVGDAVGFSLNRTYELWHDRATFLL